MNGGFDIASYGNVLNDGLMGPIRAHTNLRWIGFYLAHAHAASGNTWTQRRLGRAPVVSTWRYLRAEGWGRAPIYVGRQFVGVDANDIPVPVGVTPHHFVRNNSWTEQNGRTDGQF